MDKSKNRPFDPPKESLESYRETVLRLFAKSFFQILNEGIYFDSEQTIEPIEMKFLHPERDVIAEIPSCEFITLFEAAILISQRTSNDTWSFLSNAIWVFTDAFLAARLIPREPVSWLRFIDLPIESVSFPDFNWCLSKEELYLFTKRLWPAHLFADLHTSDPSLVPSSDQPKRSQIPHTSTLVIAKTYSNLLGKMNREPSADEVWNRLISLAGVLDSGVAEFDDESENSDDQGDKKRPGKIGFVTTAEGIKYISFKALQNRLSQIRRQKFFPPSGFIPQQ